MTLSRRSNETVKLPAQDLGQVWPRDPDQICGCCLGQPLGLDQLGETEHQARLDLLVASVADADVGKDISGASRDAFHGITEGVVGSFSNRVLSPGSAVDFLRFPIYRRFIAT